MITDASTEANVRVSWLIDTLILRPRPHTPGGAEFPEALKAGPSEGSVTPALWVLRATPSVSSSLPLLPSMKVSGHALSTLHLVLKEFASRRLYKDRKMYERVAGDIMQALLPVWEAGISSIASRNW